jgi:hypothetical protein
MRIFHKNIRGNKPMDKFFSVSVYERIVKIGKILMVNLIKK